jgi:DNA-binding response OmpR family regulator
VNQRILVVDDEPPITELLREGLEPEGYVVDVALNAAEALSLINDQLYDAAILDFALPDMNGVMLHRAIRQVDAELAQRTLFISGRTQSEDDMSYYAAEASGFLAKPFDIHHLLSVLSKLLAN